MIIPVEVGADFIEITEENQLFLIRRINIKGIETAKTKRLILEFSPIEKIRKN